MRVFVAEVVMPDEGDSETQANIIKRYLQGLDLVGAIRIADVQLSHYTRENDEHPKHKDNRIEAGSVSGTQEPETSGSGAEARSVDGVVSKAEARQREWPSGLKHQRGSQTH